MIKNLFFFFFLVHFNSWSQEKISIIDSQSSFSKKSGYVITSPSNAVFDDFGWLWIVGKTEIDNNFTYNNNHLIIQRYDGIAFSTLELPEINNIKFISAKFIKNKNGAMYLLCSSKETSFLFHINPATLSFTEKTAFRKISKNLTSIKIYPYKSSFRMFIKKGKTLFHYQYNGEEFEELEGFSVSENSSTIKNITVIANGFLFLHTNNQLILFNEEGKSVKKISKKDFITTNTFINNELNLLSSFIFNDLHFFIFKELNSIYTYNDSQKIFIKNTQLTLPFQKETILSSFQHKKNIYFLTKKNKHTVLHITNAEKGILKTTNRIIISSNSFIVSRNPAKEIITLNNHQLTHFFLKNSKISTFLPDNRAKALKEIDSTHFMVETEKNGYFLLNTTEQTETAVSIANINHLSKDSDFIQKIKDFIRRPIKSASANLFKNYSTQFPKNQISKNIITVSSFNDNNLLAGTNNGKLYNFSLKNKTFKLIFEDPKKASIIGVLKDKNNTFWLNTYAGIISFNQKKNILHRFSKKDGINNLKGNIECNFKTSTGHFFMGREKGLCYFNPLTLSEKEIRLSPTFTSISYFNDQKEVWEKKTNPNYLLNVQKITIPASYQRYQVSFGLMGIVNNTNINYKFRILTNPNNKNWELLKNKNNISFANIAPGTDVLEIAAFTKTNDKIGKTLELTVRTNEIFYKTWWFICLSILILSSLTYYFFNQLKKHQKLDTERKIATKEAEMKENMMREIHHRIKNNLQVISSLLSLQASKSNDKNLISKLQDSQGRIEAIAGIHTILYKNKNTASTTVTDFFKNIISYNKKLFPIEINFNIDITPTILPMDSANSLALILNELISNSYKHAFKKTKKPSITISFQKEKNKFTFTYFDNGIYLPKESTNSLGLQIIYLMSTELEGKLTYHTSQNFGLTLTFLSQNKL